MAGQSAGYRYTPEAASTAGIVADFYSDVKSKPTPAMLRVLVDAEVGDEQAGEDPTTNELCRRVAKRVRRRKDNRLSHIVAVAVVTGTFRWDEYFRGDREPESLQVEALCRLKRVKS